MPDLSSLTDTNGSELGGNQRTGAELVVGRNRSAVKVAIGTSGLEGGGSSGGSSRGRGAGADGRLRRGNRQPSTREQGVVAFRLEVLLGGMGYLDNGRVLGVGARRFGRLAHSQVLDVAASEDDVLKDVLTRWDGPIGGPVLSAKGADWWGVENVNVL